MWGPLNLLRSAHNSQTANTFRGDRIPAGVGFWRVDVLAVLQGIYLWNMRVHTYPSIGLAFLSNFAIISNLSQGFNRLT